MPACDAATWTLSKQRNLKLRQSGLGPDETPCDTNMNEHGEPATLNRLSNQRGPRVLIVRILEACDAGCFMCSFAWSNDTHRFSASEARHIADAARGSSLRLVRLTDGEPFLHDELPEIIAVFAGAGLLTSVITNGGLLSDRLRELVDARIAQVIVSLDSPYAESHDRYRKSPGLFTRAV